MGFDDLLACPLSPALGPIAGLGPNITSPLIHPATRVSTTAPLTSHTAPSQPARPNTLYQHPRASDQCSCDGESRPTHLPSLDRMNTNVRMPAVQLSPQRIPYTTQTAVLVAAVPPTCPAAGILQRSGDSGLTAVPLALGPRKLTSLSAFPDHCEQSFFFKNR